MATVGRENLPYSWQQRRYNKDVNELSDYRSKIYRVVFSLAALYNIAFGVWVWSLATGFVRHVG
jgi:hypothetical protein